MLKHYTRGQFPITIVATDGVPAAAVTAILAQLKTGAVIINYREPAEKGN